MMKRRMGMGKVILCRCVFVWSSRHLLLQSTPPRIHHISSVSTSYPLNIDGLTITDASTYPDPPSESGDPVIDDSFKGFKGA